MRTVLNRELAAMNLDGPLGDGEAQAGATAAP